MVLTGTGTIPALTAPKKQKTNSGQSLTTISTRSPGAIPAPSSALPVRATCSASAP